MQKFLESREKQIGKKEIELQILRKEDEKMLVSQRINNGGKLELLPESSSENSISSVNSDSEVSIIESVHKRKFSPLNRRPLKQYTAQPEIGTSLVKAKAIEEDKKLRIKMPCFMINPFGCTRVIIDILVIITLSYVIVTYPLRLGFDDVWTEGRFVVSDYIIDFVYILDFVACFVTAYKNDEKTVIVSYKLIAKRYIRGMFFFDLLAAVPFRFFISNIGSVRLLLKLLKWPKIFKLFTVYQTLRVKLRIKKSKFISTIMHATATRHPGLRRFLYALLLTTIISHFVACFWSFITEAEGNYSNWKTENGIQDASYETQYTYSFYWTVQTLLTVGYGDVGQFTSIEKIFAICWMLVSVFVYSFFVSSISAMISYNDHIREVTREYLDTLSFLKKNYDIPKKLYGKAKYAITRGLITIDDNSSFFDSLPQVLRNDLLYTINKEKVSRIKTFREFGKEFYGTIGPKMHMIEVDSGDVLYKQGDFPDVVYFVRKGLVSICTGDKDKVVIHIPSGYSFGAYSIMAELTEREHKVIALMDSQLLVIKKPDIKEVFEDFKSEEVIFKKKVGKLHSIVKFYTKHYDHIKTERIKDPSAFVIFFNN